MPPPGEDNIYLVNEEPVSEAEFNRLQDKHPVPGVSRIVMDVWEEYDE